MDCTDYATRIGIDKNNANIFYTSYTPAAWLAETMNSLQLQGFPATHSIVVHCACKADAAFSWWLDEESCKDRMFNLCITTVSLDGKTDAVKATAQKSATACWVPARSHWSNVVPMESDGVRGSSRESGFTGRTSLWRCCCWRRPAAALHGDLNLNEFLTYTGDSRPSRTIKYFMCNIRQSCSTYILNQQNWKYINRSSDVSKRIPSQICMFNDFRTLQVGN